MIILLQTNAEIINTIMFESPSSVEIIIDKTYHNYHPNMIKTTHNQKRSECKADPYYYRNKFYELLNASASNFSMRRFESDSNIYETAARTIAQSKISLQDKTKDNTNCVLCCENITQEYFYPSICHQKNGENAHRICRECWFTSFALEGADHSCPGCKICDAV